MANLIIGGVVAVILFLIVRSMVKNRKKGGCGGDCGHCGHCH